MIPLIPPPDLDIPVGRLNYAHCIENLSGFMQERIDFSNFDPFDYLYLKVIIHRSCKGKLSSHEEFIGKVEK